MRFSALCIVFLLPVTAWAGGAVQEFPDDATLQNQQAPSELPSDARAVQSGQESKEKLSGFDPAKVAVPSFPSIPDPAGKSVDFNEVVENANKAKQAVEATPEEPRLIVFVSFSMPMESLKRMAGQASRAGAAMVMRGLVDDASGKPSFQVTGVASGKLGLDEGEGFSVNPMTFRKYGISQVPAFVLLTEADCKTCGEDFVPRHLTIRGDVSLDYALHAMERRLPEFKDAVRPYLVRLEP